MKEKYKILIVHNYYQIPGGEDSVVSNEIEMLRSNGHEVVVYTRNNDELNNMSIWSKIFIPFIAIFNVRTYVDIKRIILKNDIDFVCVHNTLHLLSPAVYYAAIRCGVPVIQTVHNFRLLCPAATFFRDGHVCEDCISNGLKSALKHNCYRNSKIQTLFCVINTKIHRMTGIYRKIYYICLTEFTKEKIKFLKNVNDKRIFIKPNFVQNFGGKATPSDYYLFVGRLEEIKGARLIVDAFKAMPEKKLKMVGTGALENEIKDGLIYENINNIELLGFKNREELNIIMKNAKALIMCSQCYETFGMVILEAYSNGIPVIVGNFGNFKELVKDNETGIFFEYDSVSALQRAVEKMESMDYRLLGRNSYEFYLNKYSEKHNYRLLMKIYSKVKNDES